MKSILVLIILGAAIYVSFNRPEYEAPYVAHFVQDFENIDGWGAKNNTNGISTEAAFEGKRSFKMDSLNVNSTFFELLFSKIDTNDVLRRARVKARYKWEKPGSEKLELFCSIRRQDGTFIRWDGIDLKKSMKKNGEWGEINYLYDFNGYYDPNYIVSFYFNLPEKSSSIYLDNFTIEFL